MSTRRCPESECDGELFRDESGFRCDECGVEIIGEAFEVEDAETFAAVDEPGADPLVVSEGGCVIPVGGFVLVYGSGGAGKTTTCIDWAVHFAAGVPWLGLLEPARPLRVLIVENEGPRPEFRRKLRRRLHAWNELEGSLGQPLEGRLRVLTEPWAMLTLRDDWHREELARVLADVDLIVAGPLSGLGMEGGGTLDEIRAFTSRMHDVRELAGHPVAFMLVHHENKAGSVSGAWDGTADATVHVQAQGHGRTRVYWQKVRWCSALHQTTTHLLWADGDSFSIEEREEISEASMADAILGAAREHPGISWTKMRELRTSEGEKIVRGNLTEAAALRDRLIEHGSLVNTAAVAGQFKLWLVEDPALPRSELRTGLERATFHSPEAGQRVDPFPRSDLSRNGERERPFGTGSDSVLADSLSSSPDGEPCIVCGASFTPSAEHPERLRCETCVTGVAA